ncbi:AraC family transcriptional regulator [Sphaerisporangium sp. TRM90804]|uniref:AraC family transcriptional regulator n=1 Tax=Sphaerisporangium sp. TRM90804 TaxID=3031113 RepID=UPI0024468D49|nr:AraC family transcriptional regulator [Sphaerisporangium sp. TRM90804]MDH2425663.1 AraC family transcriptional regulator [Sphaerisporangium sp. TRM90804]
MSDVLTLLNVRSAFTSRFEGGGRWALRFPSYRHVKIGAVVAGTCRVAVEGGPALWLSAGDCYLLTGGRPYRVASDPEAEPEDGHAVYLRAPDIRNVRYGTAASDAERTVIVGGSITLDETTAALLLDCLPPVARIPVDSPAARTLRPVLRMLADETAAEPLGAAVMIEHLTQILFIQALRAHLAGAEHVPGWLGALRDPRIGTALTLMHQQATRRWTVAGLAVEVGMSRSSFAERFKALVGIPPLDYLLHWRIRSAAETLRAGDRTVASVAAEWGYTSESAFSNAFKRVTGQPPARYRTLKPPPPAAPPLYG